jgi:hypothetical protein
MTQDQIYHLEELIEQNHPQIDVCLSRRCSLKSWFVAFLCVMTFTIVFTTLVYFWANESQLKADIIWEGRMLSLVFIVICCGLYFFADGYKIRAKRLLLNADIEGITREQKIYFLKQF